MTSEHRLQPPLIVRPRFSRHLAVFGGVAHALALLVILLLPAGLWAIVLTPLLILSLLDLVYSHLLRRSPWSVRSAVWEADGNWSLELVSGRRVQARLSPATFVSPSLVVLSLRTGRWGRRSLPLFADGMDPDLARRLRRRLRTEGAAQATLLESG